MAALNLVRMGTLQQTAVIAGMQRMVPGVQRHEAWNIVRGLLRANYLQESNSEKKGRVVPKNCVNARTGRVETFELTDKGLQMFAPAL